MDLVVLLITNMTKSEIQIATQRFRELYAQMHEVCPNCGSADCNTTSVGYTLDIFAFNTYKDLNRCTCKYCGDVHTTHDRIPKYR